MNDSLTKKEISKRTGKPVVMWVIGPVASGKSTLINRLRDKFDLIVDQDQLLEEMFGVEKISLDFRQHSDLDRQAARRIRSAAADIVWANVKQWRHEKRDFVVETTGDKPALLRQELEEDRLAGFLDVALLISCSLSDCFNRNNERQRVLLPEVVASSWTEFHKNLEMEIYAEIFDDRPMQVVEDVLKFDVFQWFRNIGE